MANYNINAVTRRVVYTGSAGVGPYAFSFEILVQTDVAVYFNATLLTLTTDYTVTINANGTGSVTLVTGTNVPTTPTASDQIAIVGARDIERTTDFVTAGELRAAALNEQLDGLTIFDQQLLELTDRALTAPITDPISINMTLPTRDSRKGKYLAFNATTGDPEPGAGNEDITALAAITNDIARLADIEDGTLATDAIQTVSTNSANVTAVAGNASNINTVAGNNANIASVASNATNINTVAGDTTEINAVAGNATNINAVASNATNINSVAGNATNINTVAGDTTEINAVASNASNINTVAGSITNVNNVGGSITNVNTVATNIADVNNFADVYRIGSTDPTTSLDTGDLFFNTTSSSLKVYDGAAWTAGVTAGSGFLPTAGGSLTGNVTFTDNTKAFFGTGSDLEVFHDGSNSIINDAGTGELQIQVGGSTKLSTSSTGVDVTGTADMDTLSIGGTAITATAAELNYVDGVTSAIQTQLDAKAPTASPTFTGDLTVDTDTLYVDSTNDRVGIGTTSPARNLQIGDNTDSAAVISLQTTTSGNGSIYFGDNSATSAEYAGVVRYDHTDNSMQFWTSSTERARIDSSGNFKVSNGTIYLDDNGSHNGVINAPASLFINIDSDSTAVGEDFVIGTNRTGTTGGTELLRVDDEGRFYVPNVYTSTTGGGANVNVSSSGRLQRSTSSLRYKNTINDATHGLTELLTLRPVTYKGNNDGDTVFGGLIAEEVHDAGLTEFVQYDEQDRPDALSYGNMVSLCIKAIQELNTKVEACEAKNTEQQALIEDLQTRLAALEAV